METTTGDTSDLDNLLNSNKDLSSILDNLLDDYAKDVSDIYLTLYNIKEANTKWSEVAFTTLGIILPLPLPLPLPLQLQLLLILLLILPLLLPLPPPLPSLPLLPLLPLLSLPLPLPLLAS